MAANFALESIGLSPSMPVHVVNFQQAQQKKKEEPTYYHG
jgi:hypothetical protein